MHTGGKWEYHSWCGEKNCDYNSLVQFQTPALAAPEAAAVTTSAADVTPSETPAIPSAETAQPVAESVTPAAEAPKEAPKDAVEEKAVLKEDKPKSKFFQKIVKRLLPKNSSHSTPQSAAPAPTPVVAASAWGGLVLTAYGG